MLVGPSADAEVLTDRVPKMIPMIRSSPGGKGWELVYPRSLDGHVFAAGRVRSLRECASDPSARSDGDLAVFPLPDGAVGGIELGPLLVRFREIPDSGDATVFAARSADETAQTAGGIAVVAAALVVIALLSPRPGASTGGGGEIAAATHTPQGGTTGAGGTGTRPGATATALSSGGTPEASPTGDASSTTVAIGTTPEPAHTTANGSATPAPTTTTLAAGATPAPSSTKLAAGATPAPSSTKLAAGATPAPSSTTLAAGVTPAPTPAGTPMERDPLALAVGTPKARPNATPARTPKPSGFLADGGSLDDEQKRFEDRLTAVPTMTPSKSALTLEGGDGGVDGSLGSGATAGAGGTVRDGGKGVVGRVDVSAAGSGDVKVASAGKVETPIEARMSTDVPTVTGTIDPERVQSVVQEAAGAFRQCYEAALRRNTRIAGKVVLSWKIVLDGAVEDVATGSSTLRDEEIERCLRTRVRALRFPRPDGGTVKVEYPMVFYPAVDPA